MITENIITKTPEPFVLHRHIGSTTYSVNLFFDQNAKETLNEKVIRLLKNDILNIEKGLKSISENDNIETLQADWLSTVQKNGVQTNERSSA